MKIIINKIEEDKDSDSCSMALARSIE